MLRFLWLATRGYRLSPSRSPYLRWRMETYWGIDAGSLRTRDFWQFVWSRRFDLLRFLRWTRTMQSAQRRHARS
jgi:hypothetical protein